MSVVAGSSGGMIAVGYSSVGVIRKAGRAVQNLHPGPRVFSTKPHQSAYVARHNELLVRVPDSVTSEEASLAYLAHLALSALRQARYKPGETVAVVGLGV